MKFTFKDFFLECEQTRGYLLICSYLLLLPKCRGEGRGLVIAGVVWSNLFKSSRLGVGSFLGQTFLTIEHNKVRQVVKFVQKWDSIHLYN